MRKLYKVTWPCLLVMLMLSAALAQRPRIATGDSSANTSTPQATTQPAPQTFQAKYEGGVFGYNQKINGTLTFDDMNKRLLFRNKEQKNVLFIPYSAVAAAFADEQSRRPAAASVASAIPSIFAFPASFIKKKVQYLTLEYSDPDTRVSGVTSFKLENKEMLASVLSALAGRAGLQQRGQVFVRNKPQTASATGTSASDDSTAAPVEVRPPTAPIRGGVLNGKAISLPVPEYPQAAREAGAAGLVTVEITIDEEGNVIEARAIDGDPLLRGASEAAARQAKFSPTKLQGQPVKVSGVITYNFVK